MEWQPIDTAPRDGTSVLLFLPTGAQTVGCWDPDFDDLDEPGWTDYTVESWAYEEVVRLYPTHWMPLPTPPEEHSK